MWTDTTASIWTDSAIDAWTDTELEGSEQTALEDVSLNLSVYYQAYDDLATYLRAHDGVEIEDVLAALAAYHQGYDDAPIDLSAYYQALEDDIGTRFEAAGYAVEDLRSQLHAAALQFSEIRTALATLGEARDDLRSQCHAAGYWWRDMTTSLEAVVPLVLSDMGVSLATTDGTTFSDLALTLAVIRQPPPFRSVLAQRVASVVREV